LETDIATSLEGTSVLVTGGAGFIGGHLVRELNSVCDVTVLDDLSSGDPAVVPDGVEFVHGDVRDSQTVTEAVSGQDVIFHQAALVDVTDTIRRPLEGHSRNATGTVTVLEAARQTGARVVVASSAAVYGHPDSLPVQESAPKRPISPYGIDKIAADRYARVYADLYDLPTVTLRYFNVYGPSQSNHVGKGVVDAFLERASRDDPVTIHGDGTQTRDFIHVQDVVRANLLAATTDTVGRAYNVGTGTSVSIREVADRIVKVVDSESEVIHGDPRDGDIQHSRADIGRVRTELDFEPQYDFLDGLETIATQRTGSN
jgi:UDP-glucose 4-epimerase